MTVLDMPNRGSKGKYLNDMIVRNTLDNSYYLYLIPILRMK